MNWNRALFPEMPVLAPQIPSTASVWATEWISAWFGGRKFIWPFLPGSDFATPNMFKPDFVVLQREWATTAPPGPQQEHARDTLFTFLGKEGYKKVDERASVVVLKHPGAPLGAPSFEKPDIDAKAAKEFGDYLGHNDALVETAAMYREMVEAGDDEAKFNLGYLYYAGMGVDKNEDTALSLWLSAGEAGHAEAQYNAGSVYARRQDLNDAMVWYRKAAEQGSVKGAFNLGVCLIKAPPPLQNQQEGMFWLQRAASKGFPPAQQALTQLQKAGRQ
jgi:hypothetical protein